MHVKLNLDLDLYYLLQAGLQSARMDSPVPEAETTFPELTKPHYRQSRIGWDQLSTDASPSPGLTSLTREARATPMAPFFTRVLSDEFGSTPSTPGKAETKIYINETPTWIDQH